MNTFNSKEYAWSDVKIVLSELKGPIQATGFKVTTQREMEPLYGRGSKPHSIQYGNISSKGEISLWQSELEKLIKKAHEKHDGDITLLCFNVTVTYNMIKEDDTKLLTTDTWKSFCPTEVTKEFNQGDFRMEVTIPGLILGVEYNTK